MTAEDEGGARSPKTADQLNADLLDDDLAPDYRALREGLGARFLDRDFLLMKGPDAESYLQGQCSQDVAALAVGQGADSLLLAPDGKLDSLIRVIRTAEEEFVIDVEGGFTDRVLARLTRFKLRSKFEIEPVDWSCLALRGPLAKDAVGKDSDPSASATNLAFEWGNWSGVDVVGPSAKLKVPKGARLCGEGSWEACRIESGIPSMAHELDESIIPAEVGGLVERAVSFTKGCYTGQELVARIDSRGSRVPHQLRGVVFSHLKVSSDLLFGAELVVEGSDRSVGRITSAVFCPGVGDVAALGYVHRTVEVPGKLGVVLSGQEEPLAPIQAQVRTIPIV